MQALATLFVSCIELVEKEARLLRRGVVAAAHAVAATLFAAVAALLGLAMLLYGVYLEGAALGRPSFGAFLAGLVAFLVAAVAVRVTRADSRRRVHGADRPSGLP
jgi:hypothetical protein